MLELDVSIKTQFHTLPVVYICFALHIEKAVPKAESELSGSVFCRLKLGHFEVIERLILVKQLRQVSANIKVYKIFYSS